jgi:riboflavin synthase
MFTGLIKEIGIIQQILSIAGGKRIKINCKKILPELQRDDSIAVNGVCLTCTKIESDGFWCDAVGATLEKTTLNNLQPNQKVNLESSLRLSDKLGGHLVQGHVNAIGIISNIVNLGENYSIEITIPNGIRKYVVNEGSIAIDGISLTIANIINQKIFISVIPLTWHSTTLKERHLNDFVNIETDIIAKYVENLLFYSKENENKFTDEWFYKLGY